jgi:hypothetical protein
VPFSISVDKSVQLIYISLQGAVLDEDLIELSKQARSQPAFIAGWAILYDCSAATEILISSELIRSLASTARDDKNPLAFVAPSPAVFGLARMYQTLSDAGARVAVFSTLDLAAAWLHKVSGTGG